MSNITGTVRAVPSTPTNPVIFNVDLPTANTEVSQNLGTNVKKIYIRCRGNARIQYAFTATESGIEWITIARGSVRDIADINYTGSIYLQASEDSQTVEIETWI